MRSRGKNGGGQETNWKRNRGRQRRYLGEVRRGKKREMSSKKWNKGK